MLEHCTAPQKHTVGTHIHTQWGEYHGRMKMGVYGRGEGKHGPAWTIREVLKSSQVPKHDKQGGCRQEDELQCERRLWGKSSPSVK